MKKLHILDKISLVIIILNIISSICFAMPAGTILPTIFLVFIAYDVFLMWLSVLIGVVLNIISIFLKRKNLKNMWINILMLILFVLNMQLWMYFVACAISV